MPCVYILTNPAIPGSVKIGYTTNTARARAAELSSGTGIPAPFTVSWFAQTTCEAAARLLEAETHRILGEHRVNARREFFSVTVESAREVIEQIGHALNLIMAPGMEPKNLEPAPGLETYRQLKGWAEKRGLKNGVTYKKYVELFREKPKWEWGYADSLPCPDSLNQFINKRYPHKKKKPR